LEMCAAGARLRGRRRRFKRGAAGERGRERCGWSAAGVGTVVAIAQNLRGAGGRCDSVRVLRGG
jgi:hypothetical protein